MKNTADEKQNFWIAYADLMAGLLFVFILLVGGIIVKYMLTRVNLAKTQSDFLRTMAVLQSSEEHNKKLKELNELFTKKLSEQNATIANLTNKNSLYILQIDDLNALVEDLKSDNLDLNKTIALRDENISQSSVKIAYLLEKISQKESDFDKILHDLNATKNRIKNLTGIKVKIIASLKERLGDLVAVDPKSGDLILSSSVLFDTNSAVLKDEAKATLKSALQNYFAVLLNDKNIKDNLESIVIEGHTDSDGEYLYNLRLSQNRALAVMEFIDSWNNDMNLRKILVASGRGRAMPIVENGVENKEKSRRIEIKFTLSNKDAINEIQNFLNYDKNTTAD